MKCGGVGAHPFGWASTRQIGVDRDQRLALVGRVRCRDGPKQSSNETLSPGKLACCGGTSSAFSSGAGGAPSNDT
jgi:hypothetical protein